MSKGEFAAVGEKVEVARPFLIDPYTKQDLISAVRLAGDQLAVIPSARPSFREVKFGRIPLKGSGGKPDPRGKLHVQFSENNKGARNAVIQLSRGSDATFYRLSPNRNDWEVLQPGDELPSTVVSSVDLVNILDDSLYREGVMRPLYHTAGYDAMEIPHLLASELLQGTSMHRTDVVYEAPEPRTSEIVLPPEYEGKVSPYDTSRLSKLAIMNFNNRLRYFLSVESPVTIAEHKINKKYSFEFEIGAIVYSAVGQIVLTSEDGFTHDELERFVELDQGNITQSEVLDRGVANLLLFHSSAKSPEVKAT